jgi:GAF domain-containing protein
MDATRESEVIRTMIRLADTLVAGYDIVELLQGLAEQCGALLGASATGILLADSGGRLEVVGASDESSDLLEVLQVGGGEGPCIECYRRGEPVSVPDIGTLHEWESFRVAAQEQGYRSVHAFPMRLRQITIGSLNLFQEHTGQLDASDAETAQALADMATIGILQARTLEQASELSSQLQHALNSRVVIEQAKGFVAYRRGVSLPEAFELIRATARASRQPLSELAQQIISRQIEL